MKYIMLGLFIVATVAGCGVDWFPENNGAPTISTTSLPDATLNSPYSATLAASGGKTPYTWSVASGTPPTWATVGPTGVITGTPKDAGSTTFSVKVTDSSSTPQSATQSLTLLVPGISPATLPPATHGTLYNQTLTAFGGNGTYTFAITAGTLPRGVILQSAAIFGTPSSSSASSVSSFTLSATDKATKPFSISQDFTLTVN